MPQTYDASTGQPVGNDGLTGQQPPLIRIPSGTVPSIINIPPQVAVTVFWVAVGFGICYWMSNSRNNRGGFFG